MLGIASAGSLFSGNLKPPGGPAKLNAKLGWLCSGASIFILLMFLFSALTKSQINLAIDHSAPLLLRGWVIALSSIMAIPYFLFGLVMVFAIRESDKSLIPKLYASDLFGAACGGTAAYLIMEIGDFSLLVALPFLLAVAGCVAFFQGSGNPRLAILSLVLGAGLTIPLFTNIELFEPKPALHKAARDARKEALVTESWHRWTSFARVGLMRLQRADQDVQNRIVLGNGEGHAILNEYPVPPKKRAEVPKDYGCLVTAFGNPKNVLVLLAGAGWDMLQIDVLTGGTAAIKGVELNPAVKEAALKIPEFGLADFFKKDNINYVIDEARSNLERDHNRYDVILISWTGATEAYHTGAIGHTAQFVYTRESLASLLHHLTPNGYLIVLNTDKHRFLAMYKSIRGQQADATRQAVVLRYRTGKPVPTKVAVDENLLLIKPSGFSESETEKIRSLAQGLSWSVVFAAQPTDDPDYEGYRGILAPETGAASGVGSAEAVTETFVATDDRPFILERDTKPRKSLLKKLLTENFFAGDGPFAYYRIQFCILISLAAVLLILAPPLFKVGIKINRNTLALVTYFALLGLGFMFVEIGLINRLTLLIGNPGLALAVGLNGLIIFSGLGSLVSERICKSGITVKMLVAALILYLGIVFICGSQINAVALAWPQGARIVLSLVLIAPAGFLMGQLFPQGLAQCSVEDSRLLSWAWAINGAMSTIGAAVSWLLALWFGFSALVLIGTVFYGGILLIPLRQSSGPLD